MPRSDVQTVPVEGMVAPAWEAAPWVPEDRTVEEPRRAPESPLHLSDEHVIEVQETDSIRKVA